MQPLISGFADELIKIGTGSEVDMRKALEEAEIERANVSDPRTVGEALGDLRGEGRQVSRDYLASTLIGGAAFPAASALTNRLSRSLRNREVMRSMQKTRGRKRRRLAKDLETGGTFGAYKPGRPSGEQPALPHHQAVSQAARGGLYGSAVQMIRDRFSGSAGIDD